MGTRTRRKPKTPAAPAPDDAPSPGIVVVGMGASAGGLEAFEDFFRHAPPDGGMAFVLVSHLDPSHASMLSEILQRNTRMPVIEAEDGVAVAPDHVYVIPPNRDMAIFRGTLRLSVPQGSRAQRMPIDAFFRSLAEDQGENAIGVVLSGTGTDGTLGLRAIRGAGGAAFVQDPLTAKYDGMPASAVRSGLASYVLPVAGMPARIAAYVGAVARSPVRHSSAAPGRFAGLDKVLMALRSSTGHDFSSYRLSTIRRRTERRMSVHGLADADAYSRFLQEHPEEVQLLFKELLVNVTSFFRDPDAWDHLKKDVLPRLLDGQPGGSTVRAWVPACSTGEEAYSLAMLLRERADDAHLDFRVQIYGTDIDEDAVAAARSALYPPNIAADVSPERLRRFFAREDTGYRIRKEIREVVVFANQNVVKDPPFTKLDILCCRNLLIYLEPELQQRLIPMFHYALRPGGVLFLGSAEGVGAHPGLFAPLDKPWRIYQASPTASSTHAVLTGGLSWTGRHVPATPAQAVPQALKTNLGEITRRTLLQSYAPAAVVTDHDGNILFVYGETGSYLHPAPGHASLNVIEMAREGLQHELRVAIRDAAVRRKPVVRHVAQGPKGAGGSTVTVTVRPLEEPESPEGLLMVCFQEPLQGEPPARPRAGSAARGGTAKRVAELERELAQSRENLQSTVEEAQAANEELKSANEELQSTNEELQSTNEELDTAREEMQSVNEELVTVNAELSARVDQLSKIQNDMRNLLDSINVGTVFLDRAFAIRRFTRDVAKVFRMVGSDVGRPLADIKSDFPGEDFLGDAREVLVSLAPRVREVRTAGGAWYLVRTMPYVTEDGVIEGVVLTFTDITDRKLAEAAVQDARLVAERIVDAVREPLIVLDPALSVVSANRAFYRALGLTADQTVGRHVYELGRGPWRSPRLRQLLEDVLPHSASFDDVEVEGDVDGIGHRCLRLNARSIPGGSGQPQLILLAIEEVTDRGGARAADAGRSGAAP